MQLTTITGNSQIQHGEFGNTWYKVKASIIDSVEYGWDSKPNNQFNYKLQIIDTKGYRINKIKKLQIAHNTGTYLLLGLSFRLSSS